MTSPEAASARAALAGRLRQVAAVLLPKPPDPVADPAEDAARVLMDLAAAAVAEPTDSRIWLLLSGIASAYPSREEVDETRRTLELMPPEEAALFLLESGLERARRSGEPTAAVQVVTDRVIVDVDFTARHNLHTGIQRVVRQTLPHWNIDRQITPAAWTRNQGALRVLEPPEAARIYDWFSGPATDEEPPIPESSQPTDPRLIIPWRCVIVLLEVPPLEAAARIAALGAVSNNAVVAVGYDTIPLVSADTVPADEPTKFMPYLAAIKFADRIAGISDTAAAEFASFTSMLPAQGLAGPTVVSVPLPTAIGLAGTPGNAETGGTDGTADPTPSSADAAHDDAPAARPQVVVVGSHDPRKNHLAILHAAEMLWQDGLDFSLTFIGGGGSNLEFYRRVEILQHRGRAVDVRVAVPEAELQQAVASARFTVFPSIHEGYGLPVAESMALGTPVITTGYGSTAEIAAGGGALTVDPRVDEQITDAMRTLLTDDAELDRLRSEIRRRAERSWQNYADELWDALVAPVLGHPAGSGVHASH